MTKYLEIGQIVNTFGIKGMVKVNPFTDDIRRFDKLKTIYIWKKLQEEDKEIKQGYYDGNPLRPAGYKSLVNKEGHIQKGQILYLQRNDKIKHVLHVRIAGGKGEEDR